MNQKVKQLLASNFPFIYPHLVVNSKTTEEYQKSVKYFEKQSNVEVAQVRKARTWLSLVVV